MAELEISSSEMDSMLSSPFRMDFAAAIRAAEDDKSIAPVRIFCAVMASEVLDVRLAAPDE
jgi:hypothetical protein